MYKLYLIGLWLVLPLWAFSQEKPEWVQRYGENTCQPPLHYRGFGVGQVTPRIPKERALQQARTQAQAHLAQAIRTQVTNREIEQVVENDSGFFTSFQSVTERTTEVELPGITEQTWFDAAQNTWYVLGCLTKADLHNRYRLKTQSLKNELSAQYRRSQSFLRRGKTEEALAAYFAGQTLLRRYQEAALVTAFSAASDGQKFLDRTPSNQFRQLWLQLSPKSLRASSLDAAATQLLGSLKAQTEGLNRSASLRVKILPLRMGKTQQITEFAAHFADVLRHKALPLVQWRPLLPEEETDSLEVSGRFTLSGKMTIEGKDVRLMTFLQQTDRKWVAAAEVLLPLSVIEATGLAVDVPKTHLPKQGMHNADMGIFLDAWTTKGQQGITLRNGEKMRVVANVNRPAFLRLVYHMADGRKILLLDNHYIRMTQVNVPYEIPKDLIARAPFGAEFLQVLAAKEPFLPAQTTLMEGLEVITATVSSRLQPVAGKPQTIAEVLIPVTTLSK